MCALLFIVKKQDKNERTHTAIVFRGNEFTGHIHPDAPAIFPATAYAMQDTQHYFAVSSGNGEYQYNRTANPNRDSLSAAISLMEDGEVSAVMASGWQQSQRHCLACSDRVTILS